jgi:hypothetical protein
MQATRLSERAKAAWATKSSEEAMVLELSAEAAQKEAILMSKAAESTWKEAMGIEAEATRLSLAVQVLLCLCICLCICKAGSGRYNLQNIPVHIPNIPVYIPNIRYVYRYVLQIISSCASLMYLPGCFSTTAALPVGTKQFLSTMVCRDVTILVSYGVD